MDFHYTSERHAQIIIYLLKQYGIRKVIASPGTTNVCLVASMQQDPFFEMYSAADERSAAYMAVGMAGETGEAVVITCTGATASRNYSPGLTEAYYRKLPVLAITATSSIPRAGNLLPQCIDRTQIPHDVARLSIHLRPICNAQDERNVELAVNKAINALFTDGGGPAHINIETSPSSEFDVTQLPSARVIRTYHEHDSLPPLPQGRIAVFVGAHRPWGQEAINAIDQFCAENDAVVFCDHTSGYHGKYRFLGALVGAQSDDDGSLFETSLAIHLGEVSGDYPCLKLLRKAKQVWRVSEDGEMRDLGNHLSAVFSMRETDFFKHYLTGNSTTKTTYLERCKALATSVTASVPDNLPFSNIWIASQMASHIPDGATLHLGILNTLRSWNFFELPASVTTSCNVGGFGIDGCVSTLIGASLTHPEKLYFGIFGDLALFYDMNVLLNRHVGRNLRILLVNNGKGTEFRNYSHLAHKIGDAADTYVAAAGHYGNKSTVLMRHYAEDAGFTYLFASNKEEFLSKRAQFVDPVISKPILFEVFTDSKDESDALFAINHIIKPGLRTQTIQTMKSAIKGALKSVGVKVKE